MNIINKIFVYGTLIAEFRENAVPGIDLHIKNIESGKTNARMFDLGKYPGIVPTTDRSKIINGKIYEIDSLYFEHVLTVLDEYEGFDVDEEEASLFTRRLTQVFTENKTLINVWAYWYNKPVVGKKEIETGDYNKYLNENKLIKDALN